MPSILPWLLNSPYTFFGEALSPPWVLTQGRALLSHRSPVSPSLYPGYRAASLAPHGHCGCPRPSLGRGSHARTASPSQPSRVLPSKSSLSAATRESAFVHAIASAGVAFAVTRSCAEGSAAICGCSGRHQGSPGEGWKWGGCSEDIEFGGMVSREFADARENRPDARSAMNRHNNEAGRQVRLWPLQSWG